MTINNANVGDIVEQFTEEQQYKLFEELDQIDKALREAGEGDIWDHSVLSSIYFDLLDRIDDLTHDEIVMLYQKTRG